MLGDDIVEADVVVVEVVARVETVEDDDVAERLAVAVASEVVIDVSERATVADAVASEVVIPARIQSIDSSLDAVASVSLDSAVVRSVVALACRRAALSIGMPSIIGDSNNVVCDVSTELGDVSAIGESLTLVGCLLSAPVLLPSTMKAATTADTPKNSSIEAVKIKSFVILGFSSLQF